MHGMVNNNAPQSTDTIKNELPLICVRTLQGQYKDQFHHSSISTQHLHTSWYKERVSFVVTNSFHLQKKSITTQQNSFLLLSFYTTINA